MARGNPANLRRTKAHQVKASKAAHAAKVATKEIKALALRLLKRPLYQAELKKALDEGTLHPSIHALLYHYAYGKPKEELVVEEKVPVRIQHVYDDGAKK